MQSLHFHLDFGFLSTFTLVAGSQKQSGEDGDENEGARHETPNYGCS